jgi:hypothetical protein
MVNLSKFTYFTGTAVSAMCSPSRSWVVDDTSSWPSSNDIEPVDLNVEPVNRVERRHGKSWKLPKLQEEWRRRRDC